MEVFEKLNTLLDESLDNLGLSPDEICHEIGISRAQLHRILQEKAGLSTTLFIRQKKLDKASKTTSRPCSLSSPSSATGCLASRQIRVTTG